MAVAGNGTIRIVVADDEALIREAVSFLLDSFEELQIVGTAANGREAVRLADEQLPDVVLIDLLMPEMDGPTAIRIIKEKLPETKIIALTAVDDPTEIMEGLEGGIDGYLLKRVTKEELRLAIGRVMEGQRYLCPDVADTIFNAYLETHRRNQSPMARVTSREREVLELACAGLKGKAIAHRLSISIKTVEKHLSNLRAKLKVNTAAEMAVVFTRWKESDRKTLKQAKYSGTA